jgi:pyrimidine operon attenuation protein/uracil phosphoribosyltransferase
MALEIIERTNGNLVLAGIESNGIQLAGIIGKHLQAITGTPFLVYRVRINKPNPLQSKLETDLPAELLTGATLILVDDVQNSGRTMIYSIRHFLQFPLESVQTCVLVDRKHNNFPVRADYVGLSLSTTLQDHVLVEVNGEAIEVFLT